MRLRTMIMAFGGLLLMAQGPPSTLQILDDGKVRPEHSQHHRKKGEKVSWARSTGATKDWFVEFKKAMGSPCVEGAEFGRAIKRMTCTIRSDAKPGTYGYSSATCQTCPKQDPDIIVD